MDSLVERLREAARDVSERQKFTGCYVQAPRQRIEWEAADELTRLKSENARLRGLIDKQAQYAVGQAERQADDDEFLMQKHGYSGQD